VPARPQEVRAPRWVRTSIPAGLAAARVRRLLAGDPLAGSLALDLKASPIGHGEVLVVASGTSARGGDSGPGGESRGDEGGGGEPASAEGGSAASEGPLRVSFGWKEGAAGFHVQHQLLGSQALTLWNGRRAVPLAAVRPK
jgi:hypothetical protein